MIKLKSAGFIDNLISALILLVVISSGELIFTSENSSFIVFLKFSKFSVNCDRTKDKIYEPIHGNMCFRRLNATHQTGCSCKLEIHSQNQLKTHFSSALGKSSGSVGALHLVRDTNDINFLLERPPAPPYAAIIPPRYFTREIILKLKDSKFVSAIILINDTSRTANFSQESSCPNQFSSHSQQPQCDISKPETTWNPFGNGLLQENFEIPIMFLSNKDEIEKIIKCFTDFNKDLDTQSGRSLCSVEINAFMSAAGNSEICMRRSNMLEVFNQVHYCDPLQGKNIYATIYPREIVDSKARENDKNEKIILISARLDTTSGFDGLAIGAYELASLATLITSGHFLKKIVPKNIEKPDLNVMFVLFNGESYDYIGSQRLVYDLKLGNVFPSPFSYTRPLTLDNIVAAIDIGPLDGFNELVLYSTNDNSFAQQFVTNAQKLNEKFNLGVNLRKEVTNNIPPVSTHSFLRENSSFPAFALATKKPENKFYHSVFDDYINLDYTYHNVTRDFDDLDVEDSPNEFNSSSIQLKIRNIASIIAMSLYQIVTKNDYSDKNLASSAFVDEFLYCFLKSSDCKLNRAAYNFSGNMYGSEGPPNRYVSVQPSILLETTIWGYKAMEFALSDKIPGLNASQCSVSPYIWIPGSKFIGECRLTTHNFSMAKSPAFLDANYDWKSNRYSTWTESTWNEFSARMFLRPSATHESLTVRMRFFYEF